MVDIHVYPVIFDMIPSKLDSKELQTQKQGLIKRLWSLSIVPESSPKLP